jgi:glycosyltransferase involved in cell wall biosynthesis
MRFECVGTSGSEKTPAVSVVMPAYRTTEYISEALDSLLAQTFRDFEIIVVNDGCPDTINLERALAPYRRFITYLALEHGGPACARNAGVQVARAPLLAMLDSDDVWEPDYLEVQVAAMQADPSIDLLYPNATLFGDTPAAGRTYMDLFPSHGEVTLQSVLEQRCRIFYGLVARREAFLRAGLYNPAFVNGEDLDLYLRILNQGGRIAYHRRPLVRYRGRHGSITSKGVSASDGLLAVLRNAGRALALTDTERRCLAAAITREAAHQRHAVGRKAFFEGDLETAYSNLSEANRYFHNGKTAVILGLIRFAPGFLRWVAKRRYGSNPPVRP